jgi:hypothetical protein
MKTGIIALVIFIILGVGGYAGYTYMLKSSQTNGSEYIDEESEKAVRTVEGMLIKIPNPKDDYTHTIQTKHDFVPAASNTVSLDEYNGKNVEVKGQNSGTTLFVDTIRETE